MDNWIYEKADLEQGAYYRAGPAGEKIAVIFPHDRDRPMEKGNNAWLNTRDFGKEEWLSQGVHTFEEAKRLGDAHVRNYARDLAADFIKRKKAQWIRQAEEERER